MGEFDDEIMGTIKLWVPRIKSRLREVETTVPVDEEKQALLTTAQKQKEESDKIWKLYTEEKTKREQAKKNKAEEEKARLEKEDAKKAEPKLLFEQGRAFDLAQAEAKQKAQN